MIEPMRKQSVEGQSKACVKEARDLPVIVFLSTCTRGHQYCPHIACANQTAGVGQPSLNADISTKDTVSVCAIVPRLPDVEISCDAGSLKTSREVDRHNVPYTWGDGCLYAIQTAVREHMHSCQGIA